MTLEFVGDGRPARVPVAGKFVWTDENVERCKGLWRIGFSAEQIAVEINAPSRSAVLGRLHREQRKDFSGDLVRRKAPAHAPRGKKPRGGSNGLNLNSARPRTEPTTSNAVPDESTLCLLTELEYGMCRFPIDRDGVRWFCGAPQADPASEHNSYCGFHHRKSIQPMRPAQARGTFRILK